MAYTEERKWLTPDTSATVGENHSQMFWDLRIDGKLHEVRFRFNDEYPFVINMADFGEGHCTQEVGVPVWGF